MMTSANICHHFEYFFYETKDNMLVIIYAKFESIAVVVGILGRVVNLPPPPMHKLYLRHPIHNRVNPMSKTSAH